MRIEEENLVTSITVGGGGGGTLSLSQLSDVSDSISPSPGQVLTWNGNMWVATTPSGGGGSIVPSGVEYLNDLKDVISSSPTNDQVLTYDVSTYNSATQSYGAWVPKTFSGGGSTTTSSLGALSNVNSSVDTGGNLSLLFFDNVQYQWNKAEIDTNAFNITSSTNYNDEVTYTISINGGGSGVSQLKQLSDVNSALSQAGGEVLFYNDSLSKWDSKQLELDDLYQVSTSGAQEGYVLTCNSHGTWVAQAPSGGSGPGTTYYADGTTVILNSTTFSTIASPALRIYTETASDNVNYTIPPIPSSVYNASGSEYKYCFLGVLKDGNSAIKLDWFTDYSFDTAPTFSSANLITSGDLYSCFGSGVDNDTIIINSSGKLHVVGGSSGGGATELKELSDVDSSLSPTNGQILVYNDGQWEAQMPSGSSTPLVWEEH